MQSNKAKNNQNDANGASLTKGPQNKGDRNSAQVKKESSAAVRDKDKTTQEAAPESTKVPGNQQKTKETNAASKQATVPSADLEMTLKPSKDSSKIREGKNPDDSEESGELRDVDSDANMDDDKEQNKLDQGLNCSSMNIYNILMSGSRVTRNRLKKEEVPISKTGPTKPPTDKIEAKPSLAKKEEKEVKGAVEKQRSLLGKKVQKAGSLNLNAEK